MKYTLIPILSFQVLFRGWLWSGIILRDLCLVALPYLLLVCTSANVEGQVKRILMFCTVYVYFGHLFDLYDLVFKKKI